MPHRHRFPRARGYETTLPGTSHAHDKDEESIGVGFLHPRESEEFPSILFDLSTSDFCFFHCDR